MKHTNLDKLFQEQLKNLEATPNSSVWNGIESKLKKKKKRVVPIWWFASGIAAMLVLGMLFFPFSDDQNSFKKTDSEIIITTAPKIEIINQSKIDTTIQLERNQDKIHVAKKKNHFTPNNQLDSLQKETEKLLFAETTTKEIMDASNKEEVVVNGKTIMSSNKADKTIQTEIRKSEIKSITNTVDINKWVEEKDSLFSKKILQNNWSVTPVFAVLNSNSFSNTSPIDKSLSSTTKGENTFSYGVQIGYKLNKKWSIQSGIHLQEINFSNQQVNAVATISTNTTSVVFNSGNAFSFNESRIQSNDITNNSLVARTSLSGDLSQTYGYIEIPIEVKYNFVQSKKFSTEIVAGFSSLFLNKNEIILNSQFLTTSGKATNLNTLNFSGNIGFDFNYSLNKKWFLNLNPMLKAHLHTFSENSNGFAPFNVGLYSGVKYQF